MKRRKGFTMIEMIATTILIAFIVIAIVRATTAVAAYRVRTRDTVYLSVHNVNTMERLRQECLEGDADLLLYYDDSYFGSDYISTEVFVSRAYWDSQNVYSVEISSRVRDSGNMLKSEYVITDIGAVRVEESFNQGRWQQ